MGYAFEGWKVTYTRRYDTDYGEYGTVTNVTIGDTNIPIGYHGIFSDGKGNENSLATESIARLIAAAPKLLECLEHIQGIVSESQGVAGWHQNGQVASWDELGLREEIDGVLAKAREGQCQESIQTEGDK